MPDSRPVSRWRGIALLPPLLLVLAVRPIAAGPEPDALLAFEEERRATTPWETRRPADRGADPFRVAPLPGGDRWVGLLRGADAIVLLDAERTELDRAPAPAAPTGLSVHENGEIYVSGEEASAIARYRIDADTLARDRTLPVPGASAIRDVLPVGEHLMVLDSVHHRILELDPSQPSASLRTLAPCEGPIGLARAGDGAIANCLLEGALVVLEADGSERARIVHDGPFWSVDAVADEKGLWIAATGVENRPLDRSDGAFGYIDSFLYVYRVPRATGQVRPVYARNVSADGIVTPKWVRLERRGDGLVITTAGHASEGRLELAWPSSMPTGSPRVSRKPLPPGTTDAAGPIVANPLLDAWIDIDEPSHRSFPEPRPQRSDASRVGEALFFTTLMAPWNQSEGPRSRFTCETCHHEGYVDGRTHHTGRGEVYATTKPLVGLHGNRPYFSRALDPTMARMVHNEFRVANLKNGRDPWFDLGPSHFDWLALEASPEGLSPLFLRRALMEFLISLEHASNPATRGRQGFEPVERRGARLFRDRCESCHAARLVSDDPESRVPFEQWEENLFRHGTIVWGRLGYEKTGIGPYVHPEGARVPSLRRLHRKRPYFTNGSAPDLDAVLAGIPLAPDARTHVAGRASPGLPASERAALRAFLDLL